MNSTASSIRRENSQGIGLRQSAETRLGFPDQQSTSISFLLTCPSLLSSISPSFLLFLSVSLHLQTRVDSWTVPQSWRSTATLWGVRGGGGVGSRGRGGGWSAQSVSPWFSALRPLEEPGVQSPRQAPQKGLPLVPLVSLELETEEQ